MAQLNPRTMSMLGKAISVIAASVIAGLLLPVTVNLVIMTLVVLVAVVARVRSLERGGQPQTWTALTMLGVATLLFTMLAAAFGVIVGIIGFVIIVISFVTLGGDMG
jgi:hypothetical protein